MACYIFSCLPAVDCIAAIDIIYRYSGVAAICVGNGIFSLSTIFEKNTFFKEILEMLYEIASLFVMATRKMHAFMRCI